MNHPADYLASIALKGLGVAPLTARNIPANYAKPMRGNDLVAANDEPEPFAAIEAEANADARAIVRGHTMTKLSSGSGPSDWAQWTCSCGHPFPRRYQYQSDMSSGLQADYNSHRGQHPQLQRAVDQRDMGGRV